MDLAIVIPTYNEAGSILDLLADLRRTAPEASIILVDDNSPDGTASLVEGLRDPKVQVLRRPGKLGLGSAYKQGFSFALKSGATLIVQMDADLSHDPAALPTFLSAANQASVIVGSRYIPGGRIVGWGPWRHFCSRSAMWFSRSLLGLQVRDVTSGYRLWQADILRAVLDQGVGSSGYAFQEEMLYRATRLGAVIKEVPIVFQDRRVGRSKLSWKDVAEFFIIMIKLRWSS